MPMHTISDISNGNIPLENYQERIKHQDLGLTKTGNLIINKTVENSITDEQRTREFKFNVHLSVDGKPISGSFPYFTDENATIKNHLNGSLTLTNKEYMDVGKDGNGTISLKHGQSVLIMDLPADAKYSVTEIVPPGYTSTHVNEAGTLNGSNIYTETSFTNTCEPAAYAPMVQKQISTNEDTAPMDKKFTFTIEQIGKDEDKKSVLMEEPKSVTVDGTKTGYFGTFGTIQFTKAGEYTFRISEDAKTPLQGYTYDNGSWELKVKVEEAEGKIKIAPNGVNYHYTPGVGDEPRGDSGEKALFINNYTPAPAEYAPSVKKTITGNLPVSSSSKEFTFRLKLDEGVSAEHVVLPTDPTVKVIGEREGKFGNITFKKAGSFKILITEEPGNAPGYSYDGSIWCLTVKVEDKGGYLEVNENETKYEKINAGKSKGRAASIFKGAVFENQYNPDEVTYTPQIQKTVLGTPSNADTFKFVMEAGDKNLTGAVLPAVTTAVIEDSGISHFEPITFKQAGIYTFHLSEQNEGKAGYTYDNTVWDLIVEVEAVEENGEALLRIANSIYQKMENGSVATASNAAFTNTYVPGTGSLTLKKEVTGQAGEKNREFQFKVFLTDKLGTPVSGSFTYTGSRSGSISHGGTVVLKHDEHITISGLPEGTSYEVVETEANRDGYETTVENGSGRIGRDMNVVVTFINEKKPTDPTDPTDPSDPTDPTDPTDPSKPTDPTDPTDPSKPTDPTDPTDPTNPSRPDPENPTDPTRPSKPEKPDRPDRDDPNPVVPHDPDAPGPGNPPVPETLPVPETPAVPDTPAFPDAPQEATDIPIDLIQLPEDGIPRARRSLSDPLPRTGDESNLGIWLALLGISLVGAAAAFFGIGRKKK